MERRLNLRTSFKLKSRTGSSIRFKAESALPTILIVVGPLATQLILRLIGQ